jgi:excisionase family DNA binding protein
MIDRLGYSIDEAAAQLGGISRDSFERHVLGELRVVKVGTRTVVPARELERYLERHSSVPLADELARLRS